MMEIEDAILEIEALREENARLTQELEDRRTLGRIDQRRIERTDTERDRLRAQVAAMEPILRTLAGCPGNDPLIQAAREALAALDAVEKP